MRAFYLECSIEAIDVDYSEVIYSESEPDFWTCQNIADAHDCEYWTLDEETDPAQADAMYLIDTFNNADDPRRSVSSALPFCDYSIDVEKLLTAWNYHQLTRLIDEINANAA